MKVIFATLAILLFASCATPKQQELYSRYAEIDKALAEGTITSKEALEMKNAAHNAYQGRRTN